MDKDLVKLYDELMRVSMYDRDTERHYVSKDDYRIFGLFNDTRRNNVKKYAELLGVTFDFPNGILPEVKGESLFDEYNTIKSILDSFISDEEKNILEQRRIKIRNKIVEYNIDLIKIIINRKLNNSIIETINNNYDIDELYQMGYEFLLNYIDAHYLNKEELKYYINSLLIINIKRNLCEEIGISVHSERRLLRIRRKLLEGNYSKKELSLFLDLEESKVEELLNLDNIINSIEIEEIDEYNNLDNYLENMIISKEQELKLRRILDTLPIDSQRRIIYLFFGFNGEDVHTYRDVAAKYGVSEGTICHRRKAVMTKLTSPVRTRYIKQVMGFELSDKEKNIFLGNMTGVDKRILKQLEYFLLRQLDKDILDLLTEELSNVQKEILYIYLGYYDKSKKYINDSSLYQRRKEYVLDYIRDKITELYVINNKNEDITNYLDFLMYYYLNKPEKKVRIR